MELGIAVIGFGPLLPLLRIQPETVHGGWWLQWQENFDSEGYHEGFEEFVFNTGQRRFDMIEILARGLLDDW